jgi:hypothetical protein
MGLTKWAQNKIHEKVENYKQERQEHQEQRKTAQAEYKRGFNENVKTSSYERGKAEASERYGKHSESKGRTQGVTGRISGASKGVSRGLENYGDVFLGKGGGFGGGGLGDFGGSGGFFGGEESPRKMAPQRVTTVSRSGTVRITEPAPQRDRHEESDDSFWMGGSIGDSNRKKGRERHPLEW